MTRVNPENLRWARETAGLADDLAARRIGLNAARGVEAVDRLRALESGEQEPSRALLSRMAAAYRRPLLSFYLREPPAAAERIEDFRTLPERRPESEPLLQALVRDVRARQALVREILEEDGTQPLRVIGSRRRGDATETVAKAIVADIGFDLARFRATPNAQAAFAYLRERAEASGVFVLLIGDLGSHHTEFDTEAFRGFALADPLAPFVVINDRDAHSAWAFTLLHELAHLWLGLSGVSGARGASAIERFCNEVASQVLLPAAEARVLDLAAWDDTNELAAAIGRLAGPLRVSRTLIALRLFLAGRFGEARWNELRDRFRSEWRDDRARRKGERQGDGGPDFYVVRRQRLGRALVDLVARAVNEGSLTQTKAGRVLGVKARSVDTLLYGRAS